MTWEDRAAADGWRREGGRYVRRVRSDPSGLEEVWDQSAVAEFYGCGPSRAITRSACGCTPAVTRSGPRDRGPVEVLLTPKTADRIRSAACWQTGYDGLETGGGLFGISTPERVLIVRATVIGPEATRGPDSLSMDMSVLTDWYLDSQVSRVGCWHTHPVTDDGGLSPTDVKAMRAGFSLINRSRFEPNYVDLILTRGDKARQRWGWGRARIHAHVMSAEDGDPERATVKEL